MKIAAKVALCTLIPLVLASCNGNLPTDKVVSGKISNVPQGKGTVKIALIGVNSSVLGINTESTNQIVGTLKSDGAYAVELPKVSSTATAVYDVVAYIDEDGDGKYDLGETRSKAGPSYFVHSQGTTLGQAVGLKAGWNQINGLTIVKAGATYFPDYNLFF